MLHLEGLSINPINPNSKWGQNEALVSLGEQHLEIIKGSHKKGTGNNDYNNC